MFWMEHIPKYAGLFHNLVPYKQPLFTCLLLQRALIVGCM